MEKGVLYGVLTMIVFFIVTLLFLSPLGEFVMVGGDPYTVSYHMYSYMGITLLSGIIVTCTYLIINKIDELIKELKKNGDNNNKPSKS